MASEFFLVASDDLRSEDDGGRSGTGDANVGGPECIGKDSLKENALESPKSVVCIATKGFADEQSLNIDGSFPMLVRIEAESFLNAKGSVALKGCWRLVSIGARAFKGFEGTLEFDNCFTLASIGSKAFSLVKGSLTLSGTFSSLTSIGERAFAEASGNVQLFSGGAPGNGKTLVIGKAAFQGIVGEQSVQLPMNQDYNGNRFGGMCGSSHSKTTWWDKYRDTSWLPGGYCKVQCIDGKPSIQYFGVDSDLLKKGNECVNKPCSLSGSYSSQYNWKCEPQ